MLRRLLIYFSFILAAFPLWAQVNIPTLEGTDFWLAFLRNMSSYARCSVIIASEHDCTAHISNPQSGWDTLVTLSNGMCRVMVPDNQRQLPAGYSQTNDGWHVETSAPAVVYASNFINASHDMTSVMPTPTLRSDYMTQTYGDNFTGQQVAIVALHDSTLLHVNFAEGVLNSSHAMLYSAGDSIDVVLMRGQVCRFCTDTVYQGCKVGFTGTRFHSSRPVAVFQGHRGTYVPDDFQCMAADHLYEQCIPSVYQGRHFLVMPAVGRVPAFQDSLQVGSRVGDMVKVTALGDSCVVTVEGRETATLSAGESYSFYVGSQPPDLLPSMTLPEGLDFYRSDALSVVTSSPVQVCQYITGIYFGGSPGDPSVVVVPPLEWSINRSVTAIFNSNYLSNHYINIVSPTSDTSLVTLDGQSIAADFTPIPGGYSFARLTIPAGIHVLDADTGRLLATFYGLGPDESYAYVAGMALHKINYDLHIDNYSHCQGDTLTAVADRGDSLGVEWYLDGRHVASGLDTLRIPLVDVGIHHVAAVFTPLGAMLVEPVLVNPGYTILQTDYICPGDTFLWHGREFTQGGTYSDIISSVEGCDSLVSLRLIPLDTAPVPSFIVIRDCRNMNYLIRARVPVASDNVEAWWRSTPADSTLASQRWDSLVVTPVDTAFYALHIEGCRVYDTVFTLLPLVPVVAQMEVDRDHLDADHPSFIAHDSSLRATGRNWWVDRVWAGDGPLLQYTSELASDSLKLTLAAYNETCADTLTRVILVDAFSVWVPNVFTPGEEENRLFAPVLNGAHAEELVIYDRRGMLIVRLEGPEPAWDGTHDNIPCRQGVYAYELRYRASNDPAHLLKKQGLVTLLR
ncbi:MAG: gliding motility-associated C-terminal domain-containing protein [Bacteroidales bacterium]|nr:gliding motility-associated C-terminal domain-containing protein [Bacteroidales bacterium]